MAPIEAYATGQFNHVPVLNGTNHAELTGLLAIGIDTRFDPLNVSGYTQQGVVSPLLAANVYTGLLGNNIAAAANLSAKLVPGALLAPEAAKYGTDVVFSCTARLADGPLARSVPVYAYEFNVEDSKTLLVPPSPNLAYGATHTNELGYLYPTFASQFPSLGIESYTATQAQLAPTMQVAWTNFARSGDPNGAGVPTWPLYTRAGDRFFSLIAPVPTIKSDFTVDHNCAAFEPFDAGLAGLPLSVLADL